MESGVPEEFQSGVIRMKRAAVLGYPIQHSLSPAIHRAAYKRLGLDATYSAEQVGSDELDGYLAHELKESEWIGFSLTMPLKEVLCGLVEKFNIQIDPTAERINSANTLYLKNATWQACSTDVSGFAYLLRNREISTVSILGSGGTARAAIEALPIHAAINIYRRNSNRDAFIRSAFSNKRILFKDWSRVHESWSSNLVINTVPISGMNELTSRFESPRILVDALYSPWPPPLTVRQLSVQGEVITGLDLLCAQALDQITLMTGQEFEKDEMFYYLRKEAEAAL